MTYRPRGYIAKALYDKYNNDRYINSLDLTDWYTLNKPLPDKYQEKFVSFEPDEITLNWLETAKEKSSKLWIQIWHLVARLFLRLFLTQTDVNGLLKRGSMFILSEAQFGRFLRAGGFDHANFNNQSLIDILDVGSGDGEITKKLAKSVIQLGTGIMLKVYVTETSYIMKDRLEERQFTVINNINQLSNLHLVSCLNVLDRCVEPFKMLNDIHDALAPNGRVLLALVLPYSHYVEKNTSQIPVKPLLPSHQNLPFDEEAVAFFEEIERLGFKIESWTKAPYLCEGDLRQSFYWLIDILVVLSKV